MNGLKYKNFQTFLAISFSALSLNFFFFFFGLLCLAVQKVQKKLEIFFKKTHPFKFFVLIFFYVAFFLFLKLLK